MLRFTSFVCTCVVAAIGGVAAGLLPIDPSGARPAPAPSTGSTNSAGGLPAQPIWIDGPARIIDGDTIDIAGTRIRLEGIDAPEAGQVCDRADGGTWDCGTDATRHLTSLIRSQSIHCAVDGRDVYGRILGTCFAPQHRDPLQRRASINAEMVRRGLAWAFVKYSNTYVSEEAAAKQARAGIWQAATRTASDHRATRWVSASEAAPAGCAIKGNISHSGRIYHMPWSPWYAKVVMRADKGTRWFCSEAEAVAAGWRAAYAQ